MLCCPMPTHLVTLASYPNTAEAEVARAALEAEGIESVTNAWMLGNAVGYVKLQVVARDTKRAQVVLESITGVSRSDADGETSAREEEEPPDHADGDEDARRAWWAAIFGIDFCPLLLHLYSVYVLIRLGCSKRQLSPRGRRHVVYALVVDALVFALIFGAVFVAARGS
jgi:hypothetical protein